MYETLLAAALAAIENSTGKLSNIKSKQSNNLKPLKKIGRIDSKFNGMFVDKKLPVELINQFLIE